MVDSIVHWKSLRNFEVYIVVFKRIDDLRKFLYLLILFLYDFETTT